MHPKYHQQPQQQFFNHQQEDYTANLVPYAKPLKPKPKPEVEVEVTKEKLNVYHQNSIPPYEVTEGKHFMIYYL